jgi:hypothetical protein
VVKTMTATGEGDDMSRIEGEIVIIRGGLMFDPVPAGTRMQWSWDLMPHGVFKLMTPLVAHLGRRQEQRIWAGLKRVMEAQAAPSSTAGL